MLIQIWPIMSILLSGGFMDKFTSFKINQITQSLLNYKPTFGVTETNGKKSHRSGNGLLQAILIYA